MKCYFLAYRSKKDEPIDLSNPVGGLVMSPMKIIMGFPVPDWDLAEKKLMDMYHCLPDEHMVIAEVLEPEDKCTAYLLMKRYEEELKEFQELMECA